MRPTFLAAMIVGFALVVPGAPASRAQPLPAGLSGEAVRNARTADQHRAIADAYAEEARDLRAEAMAHRHMDSWYTGPGYLSAKLGFPRHCRALAERLEAAAEEADQLAKAHRTRADEAAREAK